MDRPLWRRIDRWYGGVGGYLVVGYVETLASNLSKKWASYLRLPRTYGHLFMAEPALFSTFFYFLYAFVAVSLTRGARR
jgi:hypothetical protein